MIYWVAISLWILSIFTCVLQGSGGALNQTKSTYRFQKIDPQDEHGNTSCCASTFYSVHSSDILFCWLFEYSIIPTNWTISLQLISRWVHQEALKQCKPCKHVNRLCVNELTVGKLPPCSRVSTKAARSQGSGMSEEGRNLIRKLERDHTQITPRIWRTVSNAPNEFIIARVWFVASVPLTENVSAVTSWAARFSWWSLYTWKQEEKHMLRTYWEHHVTFKC